MDLARIPYRCPNWVLPVPSRASPHPDYLHVATPYSLIVQDYLTSGIKLARETGRVWDLWRGFSRGTFLGIVVRPNIFNWLSTTDVQISLVSPFSWPTWIRVRGNSVQIIASQAVAPDIGKWSLHTGNTRSRSPLPRLWGVQSDQFQAVTTAAEPGYWNGKPLAIRRKRGKKKKGRWKG